MKNIVKTAFVAAIAVACGLNVFNSQKSETLSEVALTNVEALADVDPSNEICIYYKGGECGEFTESPSGDSYRIWIDKINWLH